MSSFQRSSLNVVSSLREKVAQLDEDFPADAHEDDVWHALIRLHSPVFWRLGQSLEDNVGLKVVQDLVVTKVRVLRQIQYGFFLSCSQFVVFVVVNLNQALSDRPGLVLPCFM